MNKNRIAPKTGFRPVRALAPEERITNPVDHEQGSTPALTREGSRPTVKFELDIPPAAWAVIVAVILKVLGILPMI